MSNAVTRKTLENVAKWAENEVLVRSNDAMAVYCLRNLAYRLSSCYDYAFDDHSSDLVTYMGRPKLELVTKALPGVVDE